jgi:hypothetical protein
MKTLPIFLVVLAAIAGISGCGLAKTSASPSNTNPTPSLAASPSTASFSNVAVGTSNSQTIKISNTGTATLSVSSSTVTGTGFSITGLATPINIAASGSTTFNVLFAPKAAGAATGSVVLSSNDPTVPNMTIPLTGSGVASSTALTANPISVNFNSVTVGSNSQQTVTLSNAGNTSVSITSVGVNGAGFTMTGLTAPLTLTAGQNAPMAVKFTPTSAASFNGSIAVASNAPTLTISLTGTGAAPSAHSAVLTWTASTSNTVVGYNVYRGSTTGGPYTKLNSSNVAVLTFTDSTVVAGHTYFYVVTSVDGSGTESVFSSEVSGTIPTP